MDKDFHNLLNLMKNRYHLLIGKKSIKLLSTYLYGYMHCMHDRDGVFPEFLSGFQEFIAERYGNLHRHWSNILIKTAGSDSAAFDLFYSELEKYLATFH